MITIDCREIESYKHELAVFVADWIGAIPTMKLHEFVLSPIGDEHLDAENIVRGIKEFFASLGETANFAVLPKEEVILVKSLSNKTFVKERQPESMFTCTHCGYVTQYEGLLQTHVKLHYL
ncbi:MAG TPA: C2H2-type zinc finger protein [Candidatus Nitrosotenuis sp.]|nr:C2H2-type zinc finger protein [Candidatus Nitrosotenuis sp.]